MPRDVIAECHLIARAAPGLGNPLDLSCGEFESHLRLAVEGHGGERSDGRDWMRRYVEQNA